MATGIVVGLSRQRDTWATTPTFPDDTYSTALSTQIPRHAMSSASHHRSYSDAPTSLDRLRLPPISNLIESAGRPDPSYSSTYHAPLIHTQFQSGPPRGHLPSKSPDASAWSPGCEVRFPYQRDQPQRYEISPATESHYPSVDYRRASVALPHLSSGETRHNASSHVLPQQMLDPLSPNSRTTAKNVVREEVVPGKGWCYVYDDGSVCQKVINGDTVNPKWGTTKAGKPRKRLGQACNTCREKKIKCDPSFPKCTQCQKFGRDCRFEAPSRTGNKSPRLPSSSSPTMTSGTDDAVRARRPSVALTDVSSHSESGTVSSRAAGPVEDNLSPLTNDSNFQFDAPGPSKRARLTQIEPEMLAVQRAHISLHDDAQSFSLETDPYKVDKRLTETYLQAYFAHANSSAFSLVPERLFLDWVEGADNKSPVSRLVMYCMLALGSGFSKNSEKSAHGRVFAAIALEGVMQSFGHFSIQLIQARLIFAMYEFQDGRDERAWDLCGAAVRTAYAMNLNTEEGIRQLLRDTNTVYGLDAVRLAECMRRTFWMAYTLDNMGAAFLHMTTTSNKADCFLRLPCTSQAYETGVIPKTPIFDGEVQPWKPSEGLGEEQVNVGVLGYILQIVLLCCDVRALAARANHHRASPNRLKRYANARVELEHQLQIWNDMYTAHIKRRYSETSRSEYPFPYGGVHLLYHYACMQLHRHVPHAHLSRDEQTKHAQAAYRHAENTLTIAEQLIRRKSQDIVDHAYAASSPISGYPIHYAIDIVFAAGTNAKVLENQSPLLESIMHSVQLLDQLKEIWASAKIQQKQVSDRVRLVMLSARTGFNEGKMAFCVEQSMAASLSKEEDLVYGMDRMQYLKSFSWAEQIHDPSNLNFVSNKGNRGSYSMWKD